MDVHIRVDLDADGPVVVKSATGIASERLRHERDRLQRAAHPGVVALAGGELDGDVLVMRYAGEPVARWSGSPAAVAGLGAAVAATLADLHGAGIVHGRLDASHILIGDDGRPRLCGLSHSGDAPAADDVAGLGAVLDELLSRSPTGRRVLLARAARRAASERRALQQVIEQATNPMAARRPSARALADAILVGVPRASLPAGAHASPPAWSEAEAGARASRATHTQASHRGPAGAAPAAGRRVEPDTLDRIWALAGDESEEERWAAALGTGPPDLPAPPSSLAGRTDPLPLAEIHTPGWPEPPIADDLAPAPAERAAAGPALRPDQSAVPWPSWRAEPTDADTPSDSHTLTDDTIVLRPVAHRTGTAEHADRQWAGGSDRIAGTTTDLDDADLVPDREHAGADAADAADQLVQGTGTGQPVDGDDALASGWPGAVALTGAHRSTRPSTAGREGGGRGRHAADAVPAAAAEQRTRERKPAAGRVPASRGAESAPDRSPADRGRRWAAIGGVGVAVVTVAVAVAGGALTGSGGRRRRPPTVDVGGDGCRESLVVDGATVDAGVARWSLGEPGDVATVGDWDCDGEASAALLRPATGDVFLFAGWAPAGEPVTVRATRRMDGAIAIRNEPDGEGCDRLLVDLRSGGSAPVEAGG